MTFGAESIIPPIGKKPNKLASKRPRIRPALRRPIHSNSRSNVAARQRARQVQRQSLSIDHQHPPLAQRLNDGTHQNDVEKSIQKLPNTMKGKISNKTPETYTKTQIQSKTNSKTLLPHRIAPRSRQLVTSKNVEICNNVDGSPIRMPSLKEKSASYTHSNKVKRPSSILIGSTRKRMALSESAIPTNSFGSGVEGDALEKGSNCQDVVPTITTARNVPVTNATEALVTMPENAFPYQHMGQLDPSWNMPPPKKGEKTMKNFCSKINSKDDGGCNETNDNNAHGKDKRAQSQEEKERKNSTLKNDEGNTIKVKKPDDNRQDVEKEEEKDSLRSGPLVEVINGEITIKESSIIVGGRRTTEEVDRELEGAVVEEDSTGITATYNSFKKRQKTQRWNVEETRKFFMVLRQCGTDFSTMEQIFEGYEKPRTRKQLKNKYKIEYRKNPKLIDMAMNPTLQIPLDLSLFGDLQIEKVTPTCTVTRESATNIPTVDCEEEGPTVKDGRVDVSPADSNTNLRSLTSQQGVQQNEPQEDRNLLNRSRQGKEISIDNTPPSIPTISSESTTAATERKINEQNSLKSDAIDTPLENPSIVAKEKTLEKAVNAPIALFGGVRKKSSHRPKFRAKFRSGSGKSKTKNSVK